MSTTNLKCIRYMLRFLIYHPSTENVNAIMQIIEAENSKKSMWRMITHAISTVVGNQWDIALLIAASSDERILSPLRRTVEQLGLKILTDREERKLVEKIFSRSRLKEMLLTTAEKREEIEFLAARADFLIEFFDAISLMLYDRREDLWRIAKAQAKVFSWLPQENYDYWAEAYAKLRSRFLENRIFPQNFSALHVTIIKNLILSSLKIYEGVDVVG